MYSHTANNLSVPILGINMPRMGIGHTSVETARVSLADALFSNTQQRLLAYLFGQPERSYFGNELIGLAGGGSGGVQRELQRLAQSGLLTVSRVGTQKHYRANPDSPIFAELCSIARKTVGLVEPLRHSLAPLVKDIRAAFVFGSVAKRSDTAASDIDVLILSDSVDYAEAFTALQSAEATLGRTVNPKVYRIQDWKRKHKNGVSFVVKVAAQPKLFVIGEDKDVYGAVKGVG